MLNAEVCVVKKKHEAANCNFTLAIAMANETGHLLDQATAYERAARYALMCNDRTTATPLLERALSSYNTWGSTPKVNQLKAEFPFLEDRHNDY